MTELQALLLGIAITAIPGPILIEVLRRTLAKNSSLITFLAGNFVGVSSIAVLVSAGLTAFTPAYNPVMLRVMFLANGLLLVGLGIIAVRARHRQSTNRPSSIQFSQLKIFSLGLLLAAGNPLSVAFWISYLGTVDVVTVSSLAMRVACIELGAAVTYAVFIYITKRLGTMITPPILHRTSQLLGGVLICYGLAALVRAWFVE